MYSERTRKNIAAIIESSGLLDHPAVVLPLRKRVRRAVKRALRSLTIVWVRLAW